MDPLSTDSITLRRQLAETAENLIHNTEFTATGEENPQVKAFRMCVDGVDSGEPWCMAFVQFCIKQVENKSGIVKSNIFRSERCLSVWEKSEVTMRRPGPEVGFIVIWKRRGKDEGHTGIVTGVRSPEVFLTVEGNTTSGLGIERQGDGVYAKDRRIEGNALFELVGFICPF